MRTRSATHRHQLDPNGVREVVCLAGEIRVELNTPSHRLNMLLESYCVKCILNQRLAVPATVSWTHASQCCLTPNVAPSARPLNSTEVLSVQLAGPGSRERRGLQLCAFAFSLIDLPHKPLPLSPGVWPIVPYGTQEATNLQGHRPCQPFTSRRLAPSCDRHPFRPGRRPCGAS